MNILSLLNGIPYVVLQDPMQNLEDLEVDTVVDHTDAVYPQSLFLCLSTEPEATQKYLEMAADKGAAAALISTELSDMPEKLPVLRVKRLAMLAGRIAAQNLRWPSQHMHVIGITGTNGKTSTAVMTHHICRIAGIKAGLLGTIENTVNGCAEETTNTTLPAVPLQRVLAQMRDGDTKVVIMEVSSHAIEQYRVGGVIYETAVFTNLTQDHLDYHGTMSHYAAVKARMFRVCRRALINGDDPRWQYYAEASSGTVYTYGLGAHVDFRASQIQETEDGIAFQWSYRGQTLGELRYPAPGHFQVYNVLAAATAAWLEGIEASLIAQALDVEKPLVRGRFQQLKSRDGLRVIVDYAHTPDGLEKVLQTCRRLTRGRVITVFGCGGNRDRGKRPLMGQIADRYSDWILLTSDNPRYEDPAAIMKEIREGVTDTFCNMIEDRKMAIQNAVLKADPEDLILVAGKGHETVQYIRDRKIPCDDIENVNTALRKREAERCRES